MSRRPRAPGFTLIEVLIALALIATTLGGTLLVIRGAVSTQDYLERRLYATWLADNLASTYRLQPARIDEPLVGGEDTVLGRRFTFDLKVATLDEQDASSGVARRRRVTIEVGDATSPGTPLARRVIDLTLPGDRL